MIEHKEKIVVGMTTWTKRVGNVVEVMKSILAQTLPPDEIVLSVCIQDFPHMQNDFPPELNEFLGAHPCIRLKWFLENYKGWKKHLGLLETAGDDDLLICMDDDHLYPADFIEQLYTSYIYYKRQYPITWDRKYLMYNLWSFCGMGTLYRKKDWGRYQKFLNNVALTQCFEDSLIDYIFAVNNTIIMPSIFDAPDHTAFEYNPGEALSDHNNGVYDRIRRTMIEYTDRFVTMGLVRNPFKPVYWLVFARQLVLEPTGEFPAADYIFRHYDAGKGKLHEYSKVDEDFIKQNLSHKLCEQEKES